MNYTVTYADNHAKIGGSAFQVEAIEYGCSQVYSLLQDTRVVQRSLARYTVLFKECEEADYC